MNQLGSMVLPRLRVSGDVGSASAEIMGTVADDILI